MEKKNVRFIRRNGRIIPIRLDKEQKRGAKLTASALALGAVGGLISGIKLRKAEHISQQTFDFMNDKPFSRLPEGVVDVHDGMLKARTKLNFVKKFSTATRFAASGLAFAGIHSLIKNDKDSSHREIAKVAGAAAASEAVTRGIYAGFKRRNPFSIPLKASTKAGAMAAFNELFKKSVKSGIKGAL